MLDERWWEDWIHAAMQPQVEVVPLELRCWKCDGRRMHDGCAAGLCSPCCIELRATSAA